jgi:hypothetical protein
LDSTSNSAASDKGHTGDLYSKNSDPAAEVWMALFTTTLDLYGGVLWSGELLGFIVHEMLMPISTLPLSNFQMPPPYWLLSSVYRLSGIGRILALAIGCSWFLDSWFLAIGYCLAIGYLAIGWHLSCLLTTGRPKGKGTGGCATGAFRF